MFVFIIFEVGVGLSNLKHTFLHSIADSLLGGVGFKGGKRASIDNKL